MGERTTVAAVKAALKEGREIALVDVREEGPFAEAHPLFAISLPLGDIELRAYDLFPRRSVPLVIYDDGEGLAERAARRLREIGYSDVSLLDGGLDAWRREGEIFRDVNTPSKAFGELVESVRHTPALDARELKALIDGGADLVVLDARRFEEYATISIPTGVSAPGGELVYRVHDIAPSPKTIVAVNCAGRTRSIIGAQSLINAGVPNRVAALRNGTIGWTLAGFSLDYGAQRRFPEASVEGRAKAKAAAKDVAHRAGVKFIDWRGLESWIAGRERRSLHLLDVRTPEEFAAGHLPGFRSAPGGQLVQTIDEIAGVRGGRIVVADDDEVRAIMAASWLQQLGWGEIAVLAGGVLDGGPIETGERTPELPPLPSGVAEITPAELLAQTQAAEQGTLIIDLAKSPAYRAGHIPGAWFAIRSRLAEDLPKALKGASRIVLTSPDGALARFAALEAASVSKLPVAALAGGAKAWTALGLPLARDEFRWASEPSDVYKRPYEGTDNPAAATQAYIDWELGLVEQIAHDGTANFTVL
jgi:rhodanese-related sulfurtransferase